MKDCAGLLFDYHDWTKWEQVEMTRKMSRHDGPVVEVGVTMQRRACTKCGLIQVRDLS
jgi:hypothetical protein